MLKNLRGSESGFIDKHINNLKQFNNKLYETNKNNKFINKEPSELRKKEIYKLYEHIFKSSFDDRKKEVLLTTAFGNEKWSWRVVGISYSALVEFEENKYKYKTRTFNRDHFYQRRIDTFRKMLKNLMPYEQWWEWFWKNDETIIVTIKQHNENWLTAENLDIIPVEWRLGYFTCNPIAGFSFTKSREGSYLHQLAQIIIAKEKNKSGRQQGGTTTTTP